MDDDLDTNTWLQIMNTMLSSTSNFGAIRVIIANQLELKNAYVCRSYYLLYCAVIFLKNTNLVSLIGANNPSIIFFRFFA